MNDFKRYKERFGIWGLLRFVVYPITLLITTPFVLLRSVFLSLKEFFLNHPIGKFKHFNLTPSLVSYFYSTRAWNLKKYGRTGQSDFLGLGNYYLARCFNYSLLSLNLYWKYGALTVFVGMFLWWFGFFLFPEKNLFFYSCVILALFSTLFFSNTFRSQNYNVVGWIFFPLIVIGIFEQNIFLVSTCILLSSFGSFTVVVLACILSGIYGLLECNVLLALSGFPAVIKLLLHFYPFLKLERKTSKAILGKVLKAIGANDKAKYKRKKTKALDLFKGYFILLDIQFIIALYIIGQAIPVLYLITFLIYFLNAIKIRFADDQSMHMLKLTIAVVSALYINDFWILPSLWILISPLPLMAGYYQMNVLDILPISKPLDLSILEENFDMFFSEIPRESKVLLSFENPQASYEAVFDGLRNYIELPIYIAMQSEVKLFPDWWAVFELNYEGSEEIWGTSEKEILKNMETWKCNYVICYSFEGKPIHKSVSQSNNLELISSFHWSKYDSLFEDYPKIKRDNLVWKLYKKS